MSIFCIAFLFIILKVVILIIRVDSVEWKVEGVFRVISKVIKYLVMVVFLVFGLQKCCPVFATIDPNNYFVNMSMQNQNQGIDVFDVGSDEKYVSTMRTISVSTNAPSGYRIYVIAPEDDTSNGSLILVHLSCR